MIRDTAVANGYRIADQAVTTQKIANFAVGQAQLSPSVHPGLIFIKSQTVGSSVASVTVTSAFSSTYANYKILYDGGTASTNMMMRLQLGSANTNYYYAYLMQRYAAATPAGLGGQNAGYFDGVGRVSPTGNNLNIELFNPFSSTLYTGIHYQSMDHSVASSSGFTVHGRGSYFATTSFTAFTLLIPSGTFSGGTIRVYGYRN